MSKFFLNLWNDRIPRSVNMDPVFMGGFAAFGIHNFFELMNPEGVVHFLITLFFIAFDIVAVRYFYLRHPHKKTPATLQEDAEVKAALAKEHAKADTL